jgi:hypothetical protein
VIVTFNPVDKPLHEQTETTELSGTETRESLPPTGDGHLSIWLAAMAKHGSAKAKESTAQNLISTPPAWASSGASASGSAKCVSL